MGTKERRGFPPPFNLGAFYQLLGSLLRDLLLPLWDTHFQHSLSSHCVRHKIFNVTVADRPQYMWHPTPVRLPRIRGR